MTYDTAELKRLMEAGTPGPWMKSGIRTKQLIEDAISVGQDGFPLAYLPIGKTHNEQAGALADAALIVAAVSALPDLLARVEELRDELESAADSFKHMVQQYDWMMKDMPNPSMQNSAEIVARYQVCAPSLRNIAEMAETEARAALKGGA